MPDREFASRVDDLFGFFSPGDILEALLGSEPANSENNLPVSDTFHTLDDITLLKRLLPEDVFRTWKSEGFHNLYCLSFILRHHATYLALRFHEEALLPGRDDTTVMVIGFSSLGIHLTRREVGQCRYFDRYNNTVCHEPAVGCFCPLHTGEQWWTSSGDRGSQQAVMMRFYHDKDNVYRYDEAELAGMVGRFWGIWYRTAREIEPHTERHLSLLGYHSAEEVIRLGSGELASRYRNQAKAFHPDHGGTHGDFIDLRNAYVVLRGLF